MTEPRTASHVSSRQARIPARRSGDEPLPSAARAQAIIGITLVYAVVACGACAGLTTPPPAQPAPASTSAPPSIIDTHLAWLVGAGLRERTPDAVHTGLALLALSSSGETHQSGLYTAEVRNFADSLVAAQESDGCLVPRASPRLARDHAVTAIGLVEQYGMTGRKSLREPANRAVEFALSLRAEGGAWRSASDGTIDLEATAWNVLLLGSARLAELREDDAPAIRNDLLRDLDRVTDPATGIIPARPDGDTTISAATATAIGTAIRVFSAGEDAPRDPAIDRGIAAFAATPPAATRRDATAAEALDAARYAYFGTIVMLRVGPDQLPAWVEGVAAFAVAPAVQQGPARGAWDAPAGTDDAARAWGTTYKTICGCTFHGPVGHALMRYHNRRR